MQANYGWNGWHVCFSNSLFLEFYSGHPDKLSNTYVYGCTHHQLEHHMSDLMAQLLNIFIEITQVCDESFFFKVRVVSYVFPYADFGKNTQKILARTVFTQNGEFMYGKG